MVLAVNVLTMADRHTTMTKLMAQAILPDDEQTATLISVTDRSIHYRYIIQIYVHKNFMSCFIGNF